jgi:hypothetical protein
VREEGDYSLNVTVTSNGNQSRARVGSYPYRWLSVSNPSTFEFSWRLDELGAIDDNSYAWVYVSCTNGTEEFYLYYMLYSGPGFVFSYPDSIVINATGYNTTGQWNHFSRSIFADLDTFNTADLLKIDQIEFYSYARTTGARTVLLLDDVSLISGGFSDMSYEDQGDAGSDVYAWEDVDSRFSVTNTANSGQKAGNLTVVDGDNLWMQQEMGAIPVNEHRDMWVDLFWQIADGSGDEGNELYFEFYFYDAGTDEYLTLAYFMLNTTPISSENGFDAFLLLPEVNSEGSWYNMQRNIYDDYVAAFGAPSACRLYGVAFSAQAGTGGRVEVLFDDLYLYIDPEPEITDVGRLPEDPLGGQPVSVNATVYDLSLDSVVLYYSVNNGTWTGAEMMLVGSEYSGVIPAQVGGSEVDYYVEATDAFGNVAQSDVHSYVVTPGANLLPIAAGAGAVVAVVVLVLLYMFYVKPKQAAK